VAASSVAWNSSAPGISWLRIATGFSESVGQNAHGALYQTLFQVRNGASW
jgi:hypothetical protein